MPQLDMQLIRGKTGVRHLSNMATCSILVLSLIAGCDRKSPSFSYELPKQKASLLWDEAPDDDLQQERWYAHFVQDAKVGHRRLRIERRIDDSTPLIRTASEDYLVMYRFGKRNEQTLTQVSIERENGRVYQFGYKLINGTNRTSVEARVDGRTLEVVRQDGDRPPVTQTVGWPRNGPSIFAIESSLQRKPMKPGETRTVRVFRPLNDTMAIVRMRANDFEEIDVAGESQNLLRVDVRDDHADNLATMSTMWVDTKGIVVKVEFPFMNRSMVLCSKDVALAANRPYDVDVGLESIVPVEFDYDGNRILKKAVYRVELDSLSPEDIFSESLGQRVRVTPQGIQIVVEAVSPDYPSKVIPPPTPPTRDEKSPNPIIDSQDRRVQVFADIVDRNQDPWETAKALEGALFAQLDKKEIGQVFDSAGVVAQKRSGDCSEHAVLLAALCRNHGIPARVVVGLIYDPERKGFLYHMWNEVWIRDRWLPLDATIGKGQVGADHIKFHHSSLADETPYQVVAPIINVIGRLKIEVDAVQY